MARRYQTRMVLGCPPPTLTLHHKPSAMSTTDLAVRRVRAQLGSVEDSCAAFADDACVKRYLRACNGDVQSAAGALAATLKWRQQTRPAEVECSACAQSPHSHNMRMVGTDASGRPVLYTSYNQALNRADPAKNMEHLTRTLEDASAALASRAARGEGLAESWVLVCDFHGYSWFVDTDPRAALFAARLLAHYPERGLDGRKSYWRRPASGDHDPRACPDFLASPEFSLTLTARLEASDPPPRAECSVNETSEATGAAQVQWPRQRQGLFEVLPVALCALSLASTGCGEAEEVAAESQPDIAQHEAMAGGDPREGYLSSDKLNSSMLK
ncbi:Random slug protein 5 [Symbiodinium microadriaticum]|uniref:Random slug protein 5 n=1 Tax=Symbiodinium microadriaticum TaxID=2951 RepID=A0A1Q9EPS9_SYMMI|nr:Random slug protein 5 [Symbiodinium microadriaticum]